MSMPTPTTGTNRPKRQLFAGAVGHLVEFFDFLIYSYLAIYFANQFFPSSSGSPLIPLLSAFGVFAAGFLARPIAGLMIGRFADHHGRRAAMSLSISMMGVGSLLIAIAPTYAQIGVAAPAVLVVARVLQGLSAGGEYTTAAAFLVESAPTNRRALFSSFMFVSSSVGKLLALAMVTVLASALGDEAMRQYGWRIPFGFGAVAAIFAWWIRSRAEEALRRYPKQSLQVAGLVAGITGSQYLWATFLPTYAAITTDLGSTAPMVAGLIGLTIYTIAAPLVGMLADRIGTWPLMLAFAISTAVAMVPLLRLISQGFVGLLVAQCVGLVLLSLGTSIMAVVLVDLFPQRVRVAGMGFPYGISIAVFGGTVSVIGTALTQAGAGNWFGWYMAGLSVITLVSTLSLRTNSRATGSTHGLTSAADNSPLAASRFKRSH